MICQVCLDVVEYIDPMTKRCDLCERVLSELYEDWDVSNWEKYCDPHEGSG